MLKHHLMSTLNHQHMNIYLCIGLRVLHSPHQFYSACPSCSYYFGMFYRQRCEILSHCVKPWLHLVESDATSVLCATMSSPDHIMSSFSQALLILRQVIPTSSQLPYLCKCPHLPMPPRRAICTASNLIYAASLPRHCRITPRLYIPCQTSWISSVPRQT